MGETKEDREERFWIEGNRAAYRAILSRCLDKLDESPLTQHASLVEQISQIRAALRRLCGRHRRRQFLARRPASGGRDRQVRRAPSD